MYKMEQGERLALYTYLFCGLRYDSHGVCWVGCWVHHLGGRWRLLRQLDIGGRLASSPPQNIDVQHHVAQLDVHGAGPVERLRDGLLGIHLIRSRKHQRCRTM